MAEALSATTWGAKRINLKQHKDRLRMLRQANQNFGGVTCANSNLSGGRLTIEFDQDCVVGSSTVIACPAPKDALTVSMLLCYCRRFGPQGKSETAARVRRQIVGERVRAQHLAGGFGGMPPMIREL